MRLPAVVFRLSEARKDPGLKDQGDRKQIVTEVYPEIEKLTEEVEWKPCAPPEKCPVLVMDHTESAVFTEQAKQDRHYHRAGTEIYLVIEGQMKIEVDDKLYTLYVGDMIVVTPGAWHEVQREGHFLTRVITIDCQGVGDKFV